MNIPTKSPAVNIRRNVYTMATTDGNAAEITMYGDIYEQQPTDWWGDPIEGQYVLLSDFLADLEQISHCKIITIRMNSYGGDAGVSNVIHNRLRELSRNGAKTVCIVDGVAMSGGSLIMSGCDTVRVNPSSLIMIHKCWCFLWGGYNADELRRQAEEQDAWDKMQIAIYKRKTGLSETVLSHMMADTTYMTGKEAVEKGFADELIEDAEPLNIAASADGRCLLVRGKAMHLTPGMFAPDHIPTAESGEETPAVEANKNTPVVTGSENEGGKPMTLEQLRQQEPALVSEIQSAAAAAERQRIADIDVVASLYSYELVHEAKYGEKPCTAQELTYRAAVEATKKGGQALAAMEADAAASGGANVGAAAPPSDAEGELTVEHAKAAARAFNESKKEVR